MFVFPDTEKKLKARISRYKSALNKEKKTYGYYNDGAGKRYQLFWFYFALNDLPEFDKYIKWYQKEFPDDVGEPIQKLCWALGLKRMGKVADAKYMLAELMLSNLYLIPRLLGEEISAYDIWHSSNYEYFDYFEEMPDELIGRIEPEDLSWLSEMYGSFVFRRMRKKYIEIYGLLNTVKDFEGRKSLLGEARQIMCFLDEEPADTD